MGVNDELNFFVKIKKKIVFIGGGSGGGGGGGGGVGLVGWVGGLGWT